MAGLSEVGPGSFDAYEGIRIVIPGLIVFAASILAFKTVAPGESAEAIEDPFLGLVCALIVGLILYYWDIPARAASYNEKKPTDYLETSFPDRTPNELLTAYFSLLNSRMPANTRNRALYMGSMYRIGVEMILALACASAAVFGMAIVPYGVAIGSGDWKSRTAAACFLVIVFTISVIINRGYERKSADRERVSLDSFAKAFEGTFAGSVWIYGVGIALLGLPALASAASLTDACPLSRDPRVAVFGFTVCMLYWAARYVRGDSIDKMQPRKRRKLRSPVAGAMYTIPILLTLILYPPIGVTILPNIGHVVGWTAVSSLVITLVVIRGHERKLHGGYAEQKRWLKDNREVVSSFLKQDATQASPAAVAIPRQMSLFARVLSALKRDADR